MFSTASISSFVRSGAKEDLRIYINESVQIADSARDPRKSNLRIFEKYAITTDCIRILQCLFMMPYTEFPRENPRGIPGAATR